MTDTADLLDNSDQPNKSFARIRSGLGTLGILIAAPIIALALTSFIFQSYEVDGQSMEPTLQDHDRLVVLKVAKTWSRITRHPYIPSRSKVIVFNRAGTMSMTTNREKQLIKRVIGLPGDRVVVDGGKITIYNTEHPEGFNPDSNEAYGSVIGYTMGKVDVTVPQNEIFVCGDNRGNSSDSRSFGTIPVSDVVGTLSLRILPLNNVRSF